MSQMSLKRLAYSFTCYIDWYNDSSGNVVSPTLVHLMSVCLLCQSNPQKPTEMPYFGYLVQPSLESFYIKQIYSVWTEYWANRQSQVFLPSK